MTRTEEIYAKDHFRMEAFGETFEYTVWADGLGEVKARDAKTDEIVYEQQSKWIKPDIARQWAIGAMYLRYGC
jgi:hypothetical protein